MTGIYPGTFDPITSGHLDLIERGSRLVDKLIVAVLANESKHPLFSMAERTEMLREATSHIPNVEVDNFDGLLVHYAAARGATLLMRGIRAVSDYEYELQMAMMNRTMESRVETLFLVPSPQTFFVSSSLVKEILLQGGDISRFVPPATERMLKKKYEMTV